MKTVLDKEEDIKIFRTKIKEAIVPSTIFTYNHYIKEGDNLIYQSHLDRKEFQEHRRKNGSYKSMTHGGNHCLRFSDTGDVYEEISFKREKEDTYQIFEDFLAYFMETNNIIKKEEFKVFVYEYVVSLSFSGKRYPDEETIDDVISIEGNILSLFK